MEEKEMNKTEAELELEMKPGDVLIGPRGIKVKPNDPLPCDEPGFKTIGQRLVDAGVLS